MSRYRWVVLAAGTVAAASMSAAMTGLAAIAPLLRSYFGLTLTQAGVVLGATGIGAVFTLLPWGLLADRIGERAVMASGLAGSAAALGAAAAVHSFWPLVLLLALAGASGSSVNAASGRAVMGWFRPDERGLALGIRQTAIPIGGAIAAVTLPWLASTWGVPWAFVALACGCVVGSLAGAIWLREPPREPVPLAEQARDPLRDHAMWLLSLGSWFYLVAQISTMTFVVLFLHVHRGVSTRHAGYVLAVIQLLAVGARIGAGRWSDRVGSRLRPLFLLGLALTGTMAAATAVVDAPLAFVVPVFVVAGVLGLSWNGLSFTAAAETAGTSRSGAAIGFQQTVLGVGVAVVPIMFAATANHVSWRSAYLLATICSAVGALLIGALSGARRAAAPSRGRSATRPGAPRTRG